MDLPGPRAHHLRQSIAWFRRPVDFMERGRERYGPVFAARFGPEQRAIFVSEPDAVREIIRGDAALSVVRDLRITAYAEVLDQIWGRDAAHHEVKLKGVFDIGAAAEYALVRRFSLFLRAENLLGRRNERWLGYPSFGFNIYGGARFLF